MRVLVTGSKGFAGSWLTRELESAGHEPLEAPDLDVTNPRAMRDFLRETQPDAVAHLAAVAFAPDAAADPQAAFSVAVGGTVNVFEAVRELARPVVVLVSGSSEVYGHPDPPALPLTESSPLAPITPYALSKAAQESIALSYAARFGMTVVVTRSFSHTGPGQRDSFVVPALARRILAVATGDSPDVPVGNIDVGRDISDVRDVVNAYRLLLEAAVAGRLPAGGMVVNVCSGQAVSIRWIVGELSRLAGVQPDLRTDPALVRRGEAMEIRGDPSLIHRLVGWQASIPISQTLADVWAATSHSIVASVG